MYVWVVISLTVGTAVFQYGGGLTVPTSILLGGLFCIVFLHLYGLWKSANFKPYKLVINVKIAVILTDLGLLDIEDSSAQPSNMAPGLETRKWDQYIFVAITGNLFARLDGREYSTSLWINELIKGFEVPWQPDPETNFNMTPGFFFSRAQEVYQFGIQVAPEWWNKEYRYKSALPSLRALEAPPNGRLVLGTLPYGYFPDHVHRWYEPVSLFHTWSRKQRDWRKKLTAIGWTVDDNLPSILKHRYINIEQIEI